MKATEQYFLVVLFIRLCKVILEYAHSNESYWAVLSWGTVKNAVQDSFESVDEILRCYHSNETSSETLLRGTIYFKAFAKWNFMSLCFCFFFFNSVYKSSLTFQAVVVSCSCNWTILKFAVWVIGLVIYNEVDWVNNYLCAYEWLNCRIH